MLRWQFSTYSSASGRTDVQDTIDRYTDYPREAFSRAVEHLASAEKSQWQEPHGKKLTNEHPLYEIRYKANRCATRALGFFDDAKRTFVITLICTHKGSVYKPHDAFKTAHNRAEQITSGTATAIPLQIDGEDFPSDEE